MLDETQVLSRLVDLEGEVLHGRRITSANSTIGVGILIDARRGGITKEESHYPLRNRTRNYPGALPASTRSRRSMPHGRRSRCAWPSSSATENVAEFRRMCAALKVCDYLTVSIEMARQRLGGKGRRQQSEAHGQDHAQRGVGMHDAMEHKSMVDWLRHRDSLLFWFGKSMVRCTRPSLSVWAARPPSAACSVAPIRCEQQPIRQRC
jgi:hypothetical protein